MLFLQTSVFGEVGNRLTERVFNSVLFFGLALIIIAVVGGLLYYYFVYKRKFDIDIKIISERSDEKHRVLFDKGAILKDRKEGTKYLRIFSLGIDLPYPKYNVIQLSNKGDFIELYRDGENRFYYCQTKINRKYIIRADGKIIPMVDVKNNLIDPDIDYWRFKRKRLNKSMFDPENLWMKIIPYIPHIMAGAITIFVIYILMSYLPEVLAALKEVAQTLNSQTAAQIVSSG